MSKGPSNALIAKRRRELLEQHHLPPIETIGEWRRPPDARELARRYQVWELLEWYHHEVLLPTLGIRAWFRRLWNHIRGRKIKNLSPWAQLRIRAEAEAHMRALQELKSMTEAELARAEEALEEERAQAMAEQAEANRTVE